MSDHLDALRDSKRIIDEAAGALEARMRARNDHFKDEHGIWRPLTAELALERGFALNGAQFLLDQDAEVKPVWGDDERRLTHPRRGEDVEGLAAGP